MIDYSKRLVEVDEILNHLSQSDYDKIPEEIKDAIKENKDREYQWEYNETKKLKDQNVNDETIAILSYINMEYLLNEEKKAFVEKLHKINDKTNIQNEVLTETKSNKELFVKNNKEQSKQISALDNKKNMLKRILNKIKTYLLNKL